MSFCLDVYEEYKKTVGGVDNLCENTTILLKGPRRKRERILRATCILLVYSDIV